MYPHSVGSFTLSPHRREHSLFPRMLSILPAAALRNRLWPRRGSIRRSRIIPKLIESASELPWKGRHYDDP